MPRHPYLFLGLLVLAACAAPGSPGERWREGRIRLIALASQLDDSDERACVARLSQEERSRQLFAEISYSTGRYWRYKTLPLPAVDRLKIGDRVWFRTDACDPPAVADPSPSGSQ